MEDLFLEETDIQLLYEIYGVSLVPYTVDADIGGGAVPLSMLAGGWQSTTIKIQLDAAIASINDLPNVSPRYQRNARVTRIREILADYKNLSTDPSDIDADGYSFRAAESFKSIVRALRVYTGINMLSGRGDNRTPMGC